MNPSRLSDQLVLVAKARVLDVTARSEANLRRATSDLYYANFHAICEALVEPMGAHPDSGAFLETYVALYRQMDHGQAEKRCKSIAQGGHFCPAISRFAKHFVTLKNKRELADYHPLETFKISVVRNDCTTTETRLQEFWAAETGERAAFACHVALRFQNRQQEAN